mgnify:CR=1 FL=1
MTHLSKEEVLLAFLDLSRDDRAYVLKYAVLDCSQSSLAQLHSDIAKQRFLKGLFALIVIAPKLSVMVRLLPEFNVTCVKTVEGLSPPPPKRFLRTLNGLS